MRLKSLFGFTTGKAQGIDKPLLSTVEINQLIAMAGRLTKGQKFTSNQFTQFGELASTVIGSGLDFADRRIYEAGDDPRFIDWKASARSQQTLVKNYFSEVSTPGCIVLDRRSSMIYGTRKRLKITQAIRVGVTLGVRILRDGNSLACLLLDSQNFWQPAQKSLSLFRQTIEFAARACPLQVEDVVNSSWSKIADTLKNHLPGGSRVLIISDFFQFDDSDRKVLQQLSQQYELSAVQIIDPSESNLPQLNNVSLHYGQKTKTGLKNTEENKRFNKNLQDNLTQLEDWFKNNNIHFVRINSDDELDVLRGNF